MGERDRRQWNARYEAGGPAPASEKSPPPPVFAHVEDLFPRRGLALDVACGRGRSAVWLAQRGLEVWGMDVSPVAIGLARGLALDCSVEDRCRFDVVDLDEGLPGEGLVDLVFCHLFRDRRLDRPMIDRLAVGGLLAVACLSEVGAAPGPFRVSAGELVSAFGELEILERGEGGGRAWIVARRPV